MALPQVVLPVFSYMCRSHGYTRYNNETHDIWLENTLFPIIKWCPNLLLKCWSTCSHNSLGMHEIVK